MHSKHFLKANLLLFPFQKFPVFFQNTLYFGRGKAFLRNIFFYTHSTSNLLLFPDLLKKPNFSNINPSFSLNMFSCVVGSWKTLLFQSHSTANLLHFGHEEFSKPKKLKSVQIVQSCNWQVNAKKRTRWEDSFPSIYGRKLINMGQNFFKVIVPLYDYLRLDFYIE